MTGGGAGTPLLVLGMLGPLALGSLQPQGSRVLVLSAPRSSLA